MREAKGFPSIRNNVGIIPLADGDRITTEGATLQVIHSPGHANDHVALALIEEDGALFSGDNILGVGTCIINNLDAYLKSLKRYESLANLGRIYPGHGPTIENGREKVREYIAHRERRVNQVREVVCSADGARKEWTTLDITRAVYGESCR